MTRPATKYRSMCAVDQVDPHTHKVTSNPHPIHTAWVKQQGRSTLYKVSVTSVPMHRSFLVEGLETALVRAGELVGKLAGRDLQVFTGPQRYAMGQQECPKILGSSGVLCRQTPTVGTVWCEWHPFGKVRQDD